MLANSSRLSCPMPNEIHRVFVREQVGHRSSDDSSNVNINRVAYSMARNTLVYSLAIFNRGVNHTSHWHSHHQHGGKVASLGAWSLVFAFPFAFHDRSLLFFVPRRVSTREMEATLAYGAISGPLERASAA